MNLADSYMSALKLIVQLRAALRELYDESPHLAEGNLSERIDQLLGYQSLAHEEVNTPKTELMSQTDSMQEFAPGPDEAPLYHLVKDDGTHAADLYGCDGWREVEQ
jgi:hypothetical protein